MEINVSTLIFAMINFVALLFILNSLMFKPIRATLNKRSTDIEDSLNKAEEAKRQLEQIKVDQAKQLEAVRSEALAIRASVTKVAEEEKTKIISEAHTESSRLLERAQAQIEDEKERAIATLRGEVASIAIAAASKVVSKNLTGEDQERLVNDFLKEVNG